MPELPEVETVRDGLERHVVGRTVRAVEVRRPYSVRRHVAGPDDLAGRLVGRTPVAAVRRGKFLWLPLDRPAGEHPDDALLAHLGMSGQLLVRGSAADVESGDAHPHLRVRLLLEDGGALDFVDQRTFGHVSVADLVPTADGGPGGAGSALSLLPAPVAHIGRDLLDPALDAEAVARAVRRRRTEVKRALLDQGLVSGVGNIYADEGLWRARVHPAAPTSSLDQGTALRVLDGAASVMRDALAQGGTSFDALYVNVNGASGYFDRSLAVYGQQGRPCPRCGAPVVRVAFANRSSHYCPVCQTP
ncbi:bifunctional DNA-formamidopyrimidine glycosylase/DNA-(apurinic or apyrimidinic site) lyase [Cellulomonas sp. ES6]|uniref:bifunctional DNA-formamidopyrimidine glycosylase/DNA-(apurinic or apyrimidinic site) lyase n=1 Tax=Cellulomonas sp. ES6 TaxID=3039384 RepID=UPI0024B75B8E|nr:bifunctional DNA-formamidopyrimidine glycosylase/DNA-(apurinic or apyrimidinic site) lyase [Cellulomonas sp. ES6]WHP18445.1 bifunctional DNA-formamidopyrimidine glycosylase/DNA-(apurinic or apyrimidinic site) lyase [Cellulomonas sp. ES6]